MPFVGDDLKRFVSPKTYLFLFALSLSFLSLVDHLWAMGGSVPSGYPSSFMMGLVDDDYQDALNSYGLGVNAEVNTVSQYMVPTGASNWDAVYRYLQGGLACTGTGWYSQYPGSGGAIGNFANLANGAGLQPIFIYYQIGGVYISSMTSTSFMGEYYQDWEQFLIQINTWMTAHSGKVVTVDIEPDMFGTIQQGGGSPSSYTVSVASAAQPSCSTPWVSLSSFPNTLAGYCQAMLYLKDQEISAANKANLKIAFHVSGWAVSPNPAATSGMSAAALSAQASSIATFLNACKPSSGSTWDLFFTDPSGYDGGYQSTYNWDTGGAMAQQYANWLNDLTTDVSLRCMLWQVPEGNSKMNNVLGHYTDTRAEYFLNDSPLNSAGYSHNICLYVNSGCVGVLWGPGDYHCTDVMDFFYPANYTGSASQQDGSGNSGAGSWTGTPVVDDDGGFFRTHIANNHTWGATCPLNASANTATSTNTSTPPPSTATSTNTVTCTETSTSTNTPPPPTATATNTVTKTQTSTATSTPPPPTATHTGTQTATNTVSMTSTFTPTHTATVTNTPPANTPTDTQTVTNSPTPLSNTATVTSSSTASSTAGVNTATFTATATVTSTQTSTFTGGLNTATASLTSTATPPANTSTMTPTMTSSPTQTATITNTPTGVLNTATATDTATVTNTQTSTSTSTMTPTSTCTLTLTETSTGTPTATSTDTQPPVNTSTSTSTPSVTSTQTKTSTVTLTATVTRTPTVTSTQTVTQTPTATTVNRVTCSNPYPNPVANAPLKVDVTTPPSPCVIHMEVFTTAFRKISEHDFTPTGVTTTVLWDLNDRIGVPVADGLYYVRIRVTGGSTFSTVLKVLVLK